MMGERHVAMVAARHPATLPALYHGHVAPAVLEDDGLLAAFERLAHSGQQEGREGAVHHLASLQVLGIYDLNLGQFYSLIALLQFHQPVLARPGIVIGLHAGCGGAQEHLGLIARGAEAERAQHDGCTAGMIARSRVLLLVAGLVLFIYDDETEPLKGKEYGRTGT